MSKHETTSEDYVICPHCGNQWWPDEEPSKIDTCDECGRRYQVEAEYSVTYTTKCVDDEHIYGDWRQHAINPLSYRFCVVCDHCEVRG